MPYFLISVCLFFFFLFLVNLIDLHSLYVVMGFRRCWQATPVTTFTPHPQLLLGLPSPSSSSLLSHPVYMILCNDIKPKTHQWEKTWTTVSEADLFRKHDALQPQPFSSCVQPVSSLWLQMPFCIHIFLICSCDHGHLGWLDNLAIFSPATQKYKPLSDVYFATLVKYITCYTCASV